MAAIPDIIYMSMHDVVVLVESRVVPTCCVTLHFADVSALGEYRLEDTGRLYAGCCLQYDGAVLLHQEIDFFILLFFP